MEYIIRTILQEVLFIATRMVSKGQVIKEDRLVGQVYILQQDNNPLTFEEKN